MAEVVGMRAGVRLDLAGTFGQRHVFHRLVDRRVRGVDPAVDDRHPHTRARPASPRPIAGQALERLEPLDCLQRTSVKGG